MELTPTGDEGGYSMDILLELEETTPKTDYLDANKYQEGLTPNKLKDVDMSQQVLITNKTDELEDAFKIPEGREELVLIDDVLVNRNHMEYLFCRNAYELFLPINIKDTHWYLAVVNARRRKIHVLDSYGILFGAETSKILLKDHAWPDVNVDTWDVVEVMVDRIQFDGVSCQLFMVAFIKYWTGDHLYAIVDQESMVKFRTKMAATLLLTIFNERLGKPLLRNEDENIGSPSDFAEIIEPNDIVWVRSDLPYKSVYKLGDLKVLLKRGSPMPEPFFNLCVRFLAYREAKGMIRYNNKVAKHHMDLRFCGHPPYQTRRRHRRRTRPKQTRPSKADLPHASAKG
uniref:Ubiquitin-like protease family profile domain-containing protein n=1 Tax=Setaria viridis TaxID=4556 RepID=A0A4U6TDM6_SETVI|nr:hypothetical protein SEVIR_8G054500v2 [Setaria viridis]